jgi:DUF917 family protein
LGSEEIIVADLILKSKEDVEDFVLGCTFYGTGGGGSPKLGLELLHEDLGKMGEIHVSDPSSIRDDAWVCTPFLMGSIAPKTQETLDKMASVGLTKRTAMADRILMLSVLELQAYAHVDIEALVPVELGGGNSPAPVDVAMTLGKKVVNGDYAGRAIPEISQITTYLADMPSHPTTYVDEWGNVSIVKTAINYPLAEALGKMISVAAFGLVGGAGLLMKGKQMKQVVIPNTLSECFTAGQTLRKAAAAKQDPADAVAKATKGWVLFRGKVTKKDWQDKEGYLWGTNTIEGQGDSKGHTFKIFYKNENHVTWLDDKPYVTSPDIIEVIRSDTGEPITNTNIKEGDTVSVLGLRGREPFRSPKGLEILGPKHFGYDIKYVPIEQVTKEGRK